MKLLIAIIAPLVALAIFIAARPQRKTASIPDSTVIQAPQIQTSPQIQTVPRINSGITRVWTRDQWIENYSRTHDPNKPESAIMREYAFSWFQIDVASECQKFAQKRGLDGSQLTPYLRNLIIDNALISHFADESFAVQQKLINSGETGDIPTKTMQLQNEQAKAHTAAQQEQRKQDYLQDLRKLREEKSREQ